MAKVKPRPARINWNRRLFLLNNVEVEQSICEKFVELFSSHNLCIDPSLASRLIWRHKVGKATGARRRPYSHRRNNGPQWKEVPNGEVSDEGVPTQGVPPGDAGLWTTASLFREDPAGGQLPRIDSYSLEMLALCALSARRKCYGFHQVGLLLECII